MCAQKASPSGSDWLERSPYSPPSRTSTLRWMNWPRSRWARKTAEPGMWRSSRSSTERVASAKDRYLADVAAAAAWIALTSTEDIIVRFPAALKPVIRLVSRAHEIRDLQSAWRGRSSGGRDPRRRGRRVRRRDGPGADRER